MKSFTSSKKLRISLVAGFVSLSLATVGLQNANAVTELRFAALAGIDGNFKPVIEQWNKENPDIQVKVETLPAGIPEIVKSLAASALAGPITERLRTEAMIGIKRYFFMRSPGCG